MPKRYIKPILYEEPESYIDRMQRLARHNTELRNQLKNLVTRFTSIERQNQEYQETLNKFLSESDKKLKDARRHSRRIHTVSVIYVSVKGFERLYKTDNPAPLIDMLDELYLALENIAFANNIVKLKSVGDVMLYAAGLMVENRTNPVDIVRVALEMQQAAKQIKTSNGECFWELKIGVHTGPVTALPSPSKGSTYNLTGDSINIVCRVGEATPSFSIGITGMTFELIKEFFQIRKLGKLPVKYKGNIGFYVVEGLLPELRSEENEVLPNDNFILKYGNLKFMDIQEELLDYLEKKLPSTLYYHNIKHTIDVITEVELIGWAEGVSENDILLLKFAALFHDAGHTISYKDHEYYGTVMAKEKLASHDFPQNAIDKICRLIMSTKMPPDPKDLLEKIMCDSDLDYLGRTDFIPVSNALYEELKVRNMIGSLKQWNEHQLEFIKKHQYFTRTAQQLREVNKQQQIARLKHLIASGNSEGSVE